VLAQERVSLWRRGYITFGCDRPLAACKAVLYSTSAFSDARSVFHVIQRQMTQSDRPHYQRAPIAEAIIDLRLVEPVSLETVKAAADRLKDDFPIQFPIYQFSVEIPAQSDEEQLAPTNTQEFLGWRLTNKEQSRVILLQRQGFTFSHLPPYSEWSQFSGEARRHWTCFSEYLQSSDVQRVAVRIVNRIPVAAGHVDLKHYLNVYPLLPESLPSVANALFVQLQLSVPHIDPSARVIINVASGQQSESGPHLLLDIDLFVERKTSDVDEIWALLDKFGREKNVIFETCITDEVRKLIK